ncbi:MAG: rRNA maturation RNase YbeY [Candidatus Berkelbacteria bacterium]|nr:rRNA maturation RNase YbeY [Candidatus Berkelbacteria bacterium]
MKIDLTIQSDLSCGLDSQSLESVANNILEKLNLKNLKSIIEVFLVTDEKIKNLNKKHRDIDKVTDVLSFPQEQFPGDDEQVLGTIFIASKCAKNESVSCEELFVHGVLHLLGFDHDKDIENWNKAIEKTGRKSL